METDDDLYGDRGPIQPGEEVAVVAEIEGLLEQKYLRFTINSLCDQKRYFDEEAPDYTQRLSADQAVTALGEQVVSPLLGTGKSLTVYEIRIFYLVTLLAESEEINEHTEDGLTRQFELPSPTHVLGAARRRLAHYNVLKEEARSSIVHAHADKNMDPLREIIRAFHEIVPPKKEGDVKTSRAIPAPTDPQRFNTNSYLYHLHYKTTDLALHREEPFSANKLLSIYKSFIARSDALAPEQHFDLPHLLWAAEQQRDKFMELHQLIGSGQFESLRDQYSSLWEMIMETILQEEKTMQAF